MNFRFLNNIKVYLALVIINFIWFVFPFSKIVSLVPDLTIMAIFYFSIMEETRPNLVFLIIFGLIIDFIFSPIIGHTAFCFVLISLFASSNKKALKAQRFNIVWATFMFSLALVMFVRYIILGFFGYFPNLQATTFLYLVDVASYPLLHYFLSKKLSWFRL